MYAVVHWFQHTYRSERDKELDDNEMDADAVSYCKRRRVGPETRETTCTFYSLLIA